MCAVTCFSHNTKIKFPVHADRYKEYNIADMLFLVSALLTSWD